MSIDKKSLALGLAIGGRWNLLNAQGDRSVILPVEVYMGRRLPVWISLGDPATLSGTSGEVLTAAYDGATVFGVENRSISPGTLAEGEAAVPGLTMQRL